MKKLSLILSVILCLAMMLTFASCGNTDSTDDTTSKVETPKTPEELIVGEWSCNLPLGEYMATAMGDTTGDYFGDLKFDLTMNLNIEKDGKFAATIDEKALESAVEGLKKDLKGGMKDMLADMAEELGASLDDLVSASGFSNIDEYIDASLEEIDAEAMIEEMGADDMSGTYTIDGDKICFVTDGEEASEDDYAIFTVTEDKLTLDMTDEAKDEADSDEFAMFAELLPLEFTRK